MTPAEIEAECIRRRDFVEHRLTRPASADELKDLTDFFHQENARILNCSCCGLLFREQLEQPPAETYSQDEYDPAVMEHQYPSYLAAFRAKREPFASLCPQSAHVVEVGSHYGAFLQTAAEWGWRAEGIDVGRDTARFARSKGFTVHNCELPDCKYQAASIDAVFVWNCFEQIPDPKPLLKAAKRILKPGGLLVVRTPNAVFYRLSRDLIQKAEIPAQSHLLWEAMAYNNLLGFPYLFGHSTDTLTRLISSAGYVHDGSLNSELLTLPLPETPGWVAKEEQQISKAVRLLARSVLQNTDGAMAGPWIEVWFRTTS